jgi:hypothetical protein
MKGETPMADEKPTALEIVDSSRKHHDTLEANRRAHTARLSRRDIRRAVGERGLELLDQHDEAIRQAHERLSTLGKDFAQMATDLVDLGNTLNALLVSVQHLRQGFDDKLLALRSGVNREVDDARMQLGDMDEHVRRLAVAVRDLDARSAPLRTFGARLGMLLFGPPAPAGATNAKFGGSLDPSGVEEGLNRR